MITAMNRDSNSRDIYQMDNTSQSMGTYPSNNHQNLYYYQGTGSNQPFPDFYQFPENYVHPVMPIYGNISVSDHMRSNSSGNESSSAIKYYQQQPVERAVSSPAHSDYNNNFAHGNHQYTANQFEYNYPEVDSAIMASPVSNHRQSNRKDFDVVSEGSPNSSIVLSEVAARGGAPLTKHGKINRQGKTKRSRLGCLTCRGRKKRCCERKPYCTECERLGLKCNWPAPGMEYRNRSKNNKFVDDRDTVDTPFGKMKVLRGVVSKRS